MSWIFGFVSWFVSRLHLRFSQTGAFISSRHIRTHECIIRYDWQTEKLRFSPWLIIQVHDIHVCECAHSHGSGWNDLNQLLSRLHFRIVSGYFFFIPRDFINSFFVQYYLVRRVVGGEVWHDCCKNLCLITSRKFPSCTMNCSVEFARIYFVIRLFSVPPHSMLVMSAVTFSSVLIARIFIAVRFVFLFSCVKSFTQDALNASLLSYPQKSSSSTIAFTNTVLSLSVMVFNFVFLILMGVCITDLMRWTLILPIFRW